MQCVLAQDGMEEECIANIFTVTSKSIKTLVIYLKLPEIG